MPFSASSWEEKEQNISSLHPLYILSESFYFIQILFKRFYKCFKRGGRFTNVLKVEDEENDLGIGNSLEVEEDNISSMWFKFLFCEVLTITGRVRNNSERMVTTIIIYNFIKRVIFKSITI